MIENYYRKRFFILVFICVFGVLSAQQYVRGTAVVDFSDVKASNIHVLNRTKNIYTVTDISGHFNIEASVGDTLEFKGDFLVERDFIINAWVMSNSNLIIHMNVDKIELQELLARPKLTGNFQKDIKLIRIF